MTTANRSGCWCADKRQPCEYHEGYEDGIASDSVAVEIANERETVVAWLRREHYLTIATRIENGEHL